MWVWRNLHGDALRQVDFVPLSCSKVTCLQVCSSPGRVPRSTIFVREPGHVVTYEEVSNTDSSQQRPAVAGVLSPKLILQIQGVHAIRVPSQDLGTVEHSGGSMRKALASILSTPKNKTAH